MRRDDFRIHGGVGRLYQTGGLENFSYLDKVDMVDQWDWEKCNSG